MKKLLQASLYLAIIGITAYIVARHQEPFLLDFPLIEGRIRLPGFLVILLNFGFGLLCGIGMMGSYALKLKMENRRHGKELRKRKDLDHSQSANDIAIE